MKHKSTMLKTMLLLTSILASQVYAAAVFSPANQPLGYIGAIELDNSDISSGAKAYRGWFENGGWQGDLIEYDVSNTGAMTTSIDLTSVSPAQGSSATNWSAHVQFAANELTAGYWSIGRQIISYRGSSQIAFRWANLSIAQKQAIDLVAYNNNATSSTMVDFLRGDRSNEFPTGNLRYRFNVLGDIIHSNPEYVGAPEANFPVSSYVNFANANINRPPRVYVGANDGMLHAFNALTGDEVWAYIPSMVIENLSKLAGRPYSHTYFVDGGLTAQDAFFGGAWHSVLIGSLGGGGKGLYALDVTHPDLSSENFSNGNDKKILWELDESTDDDLGYIFDSSTVTKLNDGNWYAINGNGVSSVNGIAMLYLVNIETGVVKKISTGSGSSGAPNGLSAPALKDTNNDGMADIAYAGDIDGDLWKFDLTASSPASWNLAYKLYNGVGSQPITMAPDIANHPQTGNLVLYGTGRLYTAADITNTSTQALYGIWDNGSALGSGSTRLAQILSTDTDYVSGSTSETVRTFTTPAAIDWSVYEGWVVDLAPGERLLTTPQLRAGRLKSTITNPDGFANWLLEVSFFDGGVASDTIFDLDKNGLLNTADRVDNNGDNDLNDPEDIPMAWKRRDGNMSQVTIARVAQGFDTLFLNFLNPPILAPVCIIDCIGGAVGGHIDVNTDSPIPIPAIDPQPAGTDLGNLTTGYLHEYDDALNRTYVDYFDIDPPPLSTLENVTDVYIDEDNEEFIVLIANADLSPGANITIGTKTWNGVVYTRMLHEALRAWDSSGPLLDDDGDSLIFTLNSLRAGGGTLRTTFNSLALLNGGIHPTQTRCMGPSSSVTHGRWRNGSFTIQLVRATHFTNEPGIAALERVTAADPGDLKPFVILSDGTQLALTVDFNNDGEIKALAPDYEVYGGHSVSNEEEFLYESTLYWHFGDLAAVILNEQAPCYGETYWELAVQIETESVTQASYQEILKAASFADITEVANRLTELESCKDVIKDNGGCQEEYESVAALYNLGLLIASGDYGLGGDSTETLPPAGSESISEAPVVIEGGISLGGVTSGPNYETGRRTWTDILPQ